MKFLLIFLLLIPLITKKDQVLSAAIKGNVEGLSPTDAEVRNKETRRLLRILLQGWKEPNGDLQPPNGEVIFLDISLTLPKNFQDDEQNGGRAKILKVDFRRPKEAEKEINNYVRNKTEGKTGDVVQYLPKDTKMVLIHYSPTKGKWRVTFYLVNTEVGKFFVDERPMVDIPMLDLTGLYNTHHDMDLPSTTEELPYKEDASMIITMAEPGKIDEVEEGMSAETEQRVRRSVIKRASYWTTNISFRAKFLGKPLLNLGTTIASTDTAEFSGISDDATHKEGTTGGKAKISVEDEKGTEAAEETVPEADSPKPPPQTENNRPVLHIILFM